MVDIGLFETGLWIQYIFTREFNINNSRRRGFLLEWSDVGTEGSHPEAHMQPLCAQVFRGVPQRGDSQNHKDNSISFTIVAGSDGSHSFKITIHPSDD